MSQNENILGKRSIMAFYNRDDIFALNVNTEPYKPKHTRYVMWIDRVNSFRDEWPSSTAIAPTTLAMQGLFYTYVVCFHCGGGFRDLTERDDLLKLHAILYGGCQFLYRTYPETHIYDMIDSPPSVDQQAKSFLPKHTDFVYDIVRMYLDSINTMSNSYGNCIRTMQKESDRICENSQNSIRTLTLENRKLTNKINELEIALQNAMNNVKVIDKKCTSLQLLIECCICKHYRIDTSLQCGHAICSSCLPHIDKCPQCRSTKTIARTLDL